MRHRGDEARLRRPRGLLWRSGFSDVPHGHAALGRHTPTARVALRSATRASMDRAPGGSIPGFRLGRGRDPPRRHRGDARGADPGEPTMRASQRAERRHLRMSTSSTAAGNMVSATPSGGWLQSSPAIPDLGFCLTNSRGQMFWLDETCPSSLAAGHAGRAPRSRPSLALRDGRPGSRSARPAATSRTSGSSPSSCAHRPSRPEPPGRRSTRRSSIRCTSRARSIPAPRNRAA